MNDVSSLSDPAVIAQTEGYWTDVDAGCPFAQGDILRSLPTNPELTPNFGLIITADCDIVQSKAADSLTYVEIVTVRDYLERIWIPDQRQRYVKRKLKGAVEAVNGVMKRSSLCMTITDDQLVEWLRDTPVDEIEKSINRTCKPFDPKLKQTLEAMRCALSINADKEQLKQWNTMRNILGESVDVQRSGLAEALRGNGGFPDFFLLPELPGTRELGYIALLRYIQTVHANKVFPDEVDARIAGEPEAFHRVGRLKDGIRFAITQKLAFLFSRIGLPTHFEDACKSAADLVTESLISGA